MADQKIDDLYQDRERIRASNSRLRECLKRLISGLADNVPIEVLRDAVVDARVALKEGE